MATIDIEGRKVKVDDSFLSMTPEEQADAVDDIAAQIGIKPAAPAEESEQSKALRGELSAASNDLFKKNDTSARNIDSFMRGAADTLSFGLADEIAAAGGALTGIDGDFMDYSGNLRKQRAIQAQRDDQDPYATNAGRIAGALTGGVGLAKAGAPFMGTVPANASLLPKMALGAKSGALYSGLYGFGSGEGVADRATEAAKQAAIGGLLGGAIPAVTETVKVVTKPVRDAISARMFPDDYAAQKIAERLSDAGLTAEQAALKTERTKGLSLADVGGTTTQNLLKTTTNIPGKAAARVKTQLVIKQMQQGDRIKEAVKRTFADPDGYNAAADEIANTAQKLAAPLYEQARKTPIPFTTTLEDILKTPAGKKALDRASELAGNEQVPFQQLFINIADDGTATAKRVPDARAWDYIKRAFDDMIDAEKAGTFGKANNNVRIISSLKQKMLDEIDAVNPAYAEARKVWSGQAALKDALEAGREAMTKSPEETRRLLNGMSQAEKESFKIGVADWIRGKVESTGFTQNALLKFFSSKGQLENLRAAFGDDKQFKAFREAIFAEARKRSTYNVVTGNSSTAKQLADLADAGQLRETVDLVANAATGGVVPATLKFVGSRLKMLGGFTPEVADKVAQKLMSTDPQTIRAITSQLSQIEAMSASADQKRQLVQRIITPMLSEQAARLSQQ